MSSFYDAEGLQFSCTRKGDRAMLSSITWWFSFDCKCCLLETAKWRYVWFLQLFLLHRWQGCNSTQHAKLSLSIKWKLRRAGRMHGSTSSSSATHKQNLCYQAIKSRHPGRMAGAISSSTTTKNLCLLAL